MLKFQNQTYEHMEGYSKKLDVQIHEFCIESRVTTCLSDTLFMYLSKSFMTNFNEVFVVRLRISKLKLK